MNAVVSDRQRSFIESLLSARLTTLGFATLTDAATALNLDRLSGYDASTIINRLKAMPVDPDPNMPELVRNAARSGVGNRVGRCATCSHTVDPNTGYYFLTASGSWAVHHKVNECSTGTPAPPAVIVTEGIYRAGDTIVLVYRTGNNRLAGKVWTGRSYQYRQGAVNIAAMGAKITAAEAAAFGATTGVCIACAKQLTDGRSTEVGYGPVCAKKYGWPWGDAK